MNWQSIIGPSIFIAITVAFSIAVVVGFALMLHVGRGIRKEPLAWMFVLITAAIVIGPITSGRNLSGMAVRFEGDIETFASWIWATRIVNLTVFALAVERIFRHLLSPKAEKISAWPLYLSFVAYVLTNSVINGIWGTVPSLSHLTIYPLVATLAIVIIAPRHLPRLLWFAKSAVLGVLVLSMFMAVVEPSVVLQRGYSDGVLPIRYWGLGSHANTLGPLIVCMLLCLWHQPYPHRWTNRLAWMIGVLSLALTQSKTSIVACLAVWPILLFYRYRDSLPALQRPSGMRSLIQGILAIAMAGTLAVLAIQVFFDLSNLSESVRSTRTGGQIATFSSRDQIWRFAIEEWRANPWFGYGPEIFEARYRGLIGLSQAFHAHNQFMQSLSAAGTVGVAGLLVFVLALGFYAIRAANASQGLSLALFGFIFLRGVTEVPFAIRGVANNEYFFLLVMIAVCIAYQPSGQHQDLRTMNQSRRAAQQRQNAAPAT